MTRRWIALACLAALLLAALWAPPASAQTPPGVTLRSSRSKLVFGATTTLSGRISPAAAGQTVNIVDDEGTVKATTTTDAEGRYRVRFAPRENEVLRAQWTAALSYPVRVKVRPFMWVDLGRTTLFEYARVRGALRPAHEGQRVKVAIYRFGSLVASKRVRLREGVRFSTSFLVRRPGTYRAVVRFSDDDHLPVAKATRKRSTPLPSLGIGSRGTFVRILERRLDELGYYLPGIDRSYDYRTADAVRAFNKVQGRVRSGSVSSSTWYALASPKRPRPRSTRPRFHIEIDQTKQVLYMVRRGRITEIVHVSTGANGYTHDGVYRFYRQIYGYSGGGLYHPSYFHGLRAIHGWPSVPTYPASHGCVRVPMWTAKWIQSQIDIGDQIRIYH